MSEKSFISEDLVGAQSDMTPFTGFIFGGIGQSLILPIYYPLIRLQTLAQTQLTSGNILKLRNNMKFLSAKGNSYYTGFKPYLLYGVGAASLIGALGDGLGILFGAALYPLEVAQIRLAAAGENNPYSFKFKEAFKNTANKNVWTGVSAAIIRNYIINIGSNLSALSTSAIPLFLTTLTAVALDNIRRNLIVAHFKEENTKVNMRDITRQIIKANGYKGLFRGLLLYPHLYLSFAMLLTGNIKVPEEQVNQEIEHTNQPIK